MTYNVVSSDHRDITVEGTRERCDFNQIMIPYTGWNEVKIEIESPMMVSPLPKLCLLTPS